MIRLAGLRPDKEIEIRITGLRPGEKLHEELFHGSEVLMETEHPGLKLATPRTADAELLARSLDELTALLQQGDRGKAVRLLQQLVPEFRGGHAADRRSATAGA
jgi:O-antigen biosynthesis protein WbqV